MGSRKPALDGGTDPSTKGPFLGERTCPRMPDDACAVSCAKMAKPIEMPFALCTRVGRKKHVLHGDALAQPGEYD